MKVEQIALGFCEENSPSTSSLSISFKRLRPLAPKLGDATQTVTSFDLKGFIEHANQISPEAKCTTHIPVVSHSGGTRWNPTQEQIRRLEVLYRDGLRTPNAHQIERITAELGKYGRIEGKNVFYWFQNHKARERQKQKRSALLTLSPSSQLISFASNAECEAKKEYHDASCKRQCRSRGALLDAEEGASDGTLELFPLHPEWGS